ncbi:TetR/AcrR family transcriptional regulator [Mycobacterium kubicae]|uniref:TetR/AcrR family transcriptional regulator n=1 Tax=Mycobacterium kubicae TaxID=120959 RepID=UPI001F12282A|nr:TetR/AcrR family transcriptional regulator [Mycobacterium kubicae]
MAGRCVAAPIPWVQLRPPLTHIIDNMSEQSRRGKSQRAGIEAPAPTRSERVLQAAAELLRTGGIDAVSTRAVAAAAGVQPPVIYREFGGKDELLDAVSQFVLESYLHSKRRRLQQASGDPLHYLRESWDRHVEFGLKHPDTYVLTFVQSRAGARSTAAAETIKLLEGAIARVADEGRLRMSVERATMLFHSAGIGTVLTLIAMPPDERDMQLSVLGRDNVISAICNDKKAAAAKSSPLTARAVALREAVRRADDTPLSPAERSLLLEWLKRLADRD